MELGWMGPESLEVCGGLLLPQVAEAIKAGEPVTTLTVTEDGLALGALAAHLEDGGCVIDSLYVSPEHRRRGVGRMLAAGLEDLLTGSGAARLRLSFTVTLPEHETMAPFLAAMGFAPEDDEGQNIYFTTLDEVAAASFFAGQAGTDGGVPFAGLSPSVLAQTARDALKDGAPMTPELLENNPEEDVSCALVRNGKALAFVAFDRSCCDRLTLACAWAGVAGPAAMAGLLRQAFGLAREKYQGDVPLAVQAVTPASAALVRGLLPQARPVSFTYAKPLDG
ncbi:GNAT family N-acetyltransferase [Pseudoflavonifractor phocaeensis]|uniref:GNAT family N-acetyltransferase n=1 Tax=Pseudoflavonifractor phocaeensis TaxID=1870988 RepID=UPI00195704D6|nr:GNAT family N-acetyltransferase [Pseudoflavonifractor phocaeensis]MBM6926515.1 GNAT family N-acetyltransferase [Pseudoflavonifractor phocaeensis]